MRRHYAEDQHRHTTHHDGDGERHPVELHDVETRQLRGRRGDQQAQQQPRGNDAEGTAGDREHAALHQQLSGNVGKARAECPANEEFSRARARAEQEQVADVDAGDHEEEEHRCAEEEEHGTRVAGHRDREAGSPRRR